MLQEDMNRRRTAWEFERRFNVVGLLVLFGGLPLFIYVGGAYLLHGFFDAPAFCLALCAYLFFGLAAASIGRRAITSALEQEAVSTPGPTARVPGTGSP